MHGIGWSRSGAFVGLGLLVTLVACGGTGASADTDTDGGSSTGAEGEDTAESAPDPSAGVTSAATSTSATATTNTPTSDTVDPPGDDTGSDLPPGEGCCEAHAGAGCNEEGPRDCVCESAPECCVFDWLPECAALAPACGATCEGEGSTGGSDSESESESESESDTQTNGCDPTSIELDYEDAELSGAWNVVTSQSGEGQVIAITGQQTGGAINFDVDIPCEDDWRVWVRYFEQGDSDSYYVTLDGEPNPAGVFEGDCTQGGAGYSWRLLRYRTEDMQLCETVQDPWVAAWDAGVHNVRFTFRESPALGRIIVTNDPAFTP